jgi:hypothetical protein
MCGGHQPDHSTIGKFIHMHRAALSDEFHVDLVKQVAGKLDLRPGVAALDGTVIEAASSRFRQLRAERRRRQSKRRQRRRYCRLASFTEWLRVLVDNQDEVIRVVCAPDVIENELQPG